MDLGALSTRQAIDKRFKELRAQSRQELLAQIYGKDAKKANDASVQQDLSQAFTAILNNYDFDKANPTVVQIAQIFNINLDSIKRMEPTQRQTFLHEMMMAKLEETTRIVQRGKEQEMSKINNPQQNHFEWLGLRTKYTQLRPIFEEILLQKVKLFDNQLTRLLECSSPPLATISTQVFSKSTKSTARSKTLESTLRARRVQSDIAEQFCDVKIRDKSEFLLQKWTAKEQQQFSAKKAVFRSNLKINNVPVLFQFVKKYTATVKARDNIYRKWQQRQRLGITPEEVRYLCATSLFLNNSLAKSEKQRIKSNIQAVGSQLVSKLQTNIAQKIIETYHQLMKKVSDLRAKYYEELTQLRKKEQQAGAKMQASQLSKCNKKEQFLKYRSMFERIVNSQRLKLRLNKRIYKWVKLFAKKLKQSIQKQLLVKGQSEAVFKRLAGDRQAQTVLMRMKTKYPSSKVIKREDQYSHRLKYRVYMPSQRFQYEPSFEKTIDKLNRTRLNSTQKTIFKKQLTGGPKRQQLYLTVDLSKKQVYLSSPIILKHIITIQAKWRSVYQRKRFLILLEQARERERLEFDEKVQSLTRLYPQGTKINMKAVQGRLRRVHMKLNSILHPYVRTPKRPTNIYTAFCTNTISSSELKNKHARNGQIRLGEFARMVEQNQYGMLCRSGIVVTSRQINGNIMGHGANAMWWAVYHSNLELTKRFLQGGGDPNSADSQENTCLHVAVKNGDMQIIFLLLDYGADLNRKNAKKATCLLHASKHMLKLLGLEQGSILGQKDNNSIFYRKAQQQDPYPDHYY